MKAKAPQAQGMKWHARVKRKAKVRASEMVAWGESASGDGDGGTAAVDAELASGKEKRRASTKKRKFESWNERAGGNPIGETKRKTKKKKRSAVKSETEVEARAEARAVVAPAKREKKKATSTFASGNPFAALARRR